MGLMDAVVAYLASQKLVLVAAESCTAGLVTAELAQVPGSGQVLEAGLTVYSPEAKQRLLGVAAETIDRWGLTSEAVAREMALGALGLSPASVAVADTGVAGPQQPADGTPVGTLCLAWAFRRGLRCCHFRETPQLGGDPYLLRQPAARHVLARISRYHHPS